MLRPLRAVLIVLLIAASGQGQSDRRTRDPWQRPLEVMDVLGIAVGSIVADIGSGDGYFSLHIAERVGAGGKVFAVDIEERPLAAVRREAGRRGLPQIETVLGAAHDPRLAADCCDVILVVNAYHEMRDYDAMMQAIFRALKPGGRLAIIDKEARPNLPRSSYHSGHEIAEETVREDAEHAGFRFVSKEKGFVSDRRENWYFLVFQKPSAL